MTTTPQRSEIEAAWQRRFIAGGLARGYDPGMLAEQSRLCVQRGLDKSEILEGNLEHAIHSACDGAQAHRTEFSGFMCWVNVKPVTEVCSAWNGSASVAVLDLFAGNGGYIRSAERLVASVRGDGRKFILVIHTDAVSADTSVVAGADVVISRPDVMLKFHAIRKPGEKKPIGAPATSPEDATDTSCFWNAALDPDSPPELLNPFNEAARRVYVEKMNARLGPLLGNMDVAALRQHFDGAPFEDGTRELIQAALEKCQGLRSFLENFSRNMIQEVWLNLTAVESYWLGLLDKVIPAEFP